MPEPGISTGTSNAGASRSSPGSSADNSSSSSSNDKTSTESISQSPTTADNLASGPTTAESLSGKAANDATNSASGTQSGSDAPDSNAAMTPEQARMAAERSAMPAEKPDTNSLPENKDSKGINESFDLLATDNPHFNVELVSVDLKVEGPDAGIDAEKRKASVSAGKFDFDVTLFRGKTEFGLSSAADVSLTGNFKTVNANGNLEAFGELNGFKSKVGAKGSAGAEAMAIDGKASLDLNLTPKSIADSIGGVYNSYIDPLVDKVAGYDVADIPEAPDSWDKGIAASGYIEGGFGASAKAHAGLEFGKGTRNGLSAGVKVGAGPVAGIGGFIGVKWD